MQHKSYTVQQYVYTALATRGDRPDQVLYDNYKPEQGGVRAAEEFS